MVAPGVARGACQPCCHFVSAGSAGVGGDTRMASTGNGSTASKTDTYPGDQPFKQVAAEEAIAANFLTAIPDGHCLYGWGLIMWVCMLFQ